MTDNRRMDGWKDGWTDGWIDNTKPISLRLWQGISNLYEKAILR